VRYVENVKMLVLQRICFCIISVLFMRIDVAMPAFAEMDKKTLITDGKARVESFCSAEFQGDEI